MRKFILTVGTALAMLFSTSSAWSAAYFIGGQWYYFSLNLDAQLDGVTGKVLKDGTFIGYDITILSAEVACVNPNNTLINPGVGPEIFVSAQGEELTDDSLVKSNRKKGKQFVTTATQANLVPPDVVLCKDAPGQSEWNSIWWQNDAAGTGACLKGDALLDGSPDTPVCYEQLAVVADPNAPNTLTYLTGAMTGESFDNDGSWVRAFVPQHFSYVAYVNTNGSDVDTITGECFLPLDPNGQPYGPLNPPAGGFAQGGLQYIGPTCELTPP